MNDWPKHPDGSNKTIGEMTPEESRPLLRAAFLRSKLGDVPALKDAFAIDNASEGEGWMSSFDPETDH